MRFSAPGPARAPRQLLAARQIASGVPTDRHRRSLRSDGPAGLSAAPVAERRYDGGSYRISERSAHRMRRRARQAQCRRPRRRQALGGASPPIVVSLGGHGRAGSRAGQGLATLPVSLVQSRARARHASRPRCSCAGGAAHRLHRRRAASALPAAACAAFGIASASFLALLPRHPHRPGSTSPSSRATASPRPTRPPTAFRPRAISWVMSGGLAAGDRRSSDGDLDPGCSFRALPFAGAFLGQAALALLSIVVVSFLRPTPVRVATRQGWRPALARDRPAAALHRRRRRGPGLLRPHELPDDGGAAGDGRLRPFRSARRRSGIQWHVLGHVRTELLHRPPDRRGSARSGSPRPGSC